MSDTYDLVDGERAIRCRKFGTTSHNPSDVRARYCGFCRMLHDDIEVFEALRDAMSFAVPGSVPGA